MYYLCKKYLVYIIDQTHQLFNEPKNGIVSYNKEQREYYPTMCKRLFLISNILQIIYEKKFLLKLIVI